jgi:hypothetical protein
VWKNVRLQLLLHECPSFIYAPCDYYPVFCRGFYNLWRRYSAWDVSNSYYCPWPEATKSGIPLSDIPRHSVLYSICFLLAICDESSWLILVQFLSTQEDEYLLRRPRSLAAFLPSTQPHCSYARHIRESAGHCNRRFVRSSMKYKITCG